MDRNSLVALVPMLSPGVRERVLAYFEQNKPDYTPYVEYKEAEAYKAAQKEKLAGGKVAPEFAYPTPDGKQQLGPDDFRGKYVLIDFWASW